MQRSGGQSSLLPSSNYLYCLYAPWQFGFKLTKRPSINCAMLVLSSRACPFTNFWKQHSLILGRRLYQLPSGYLRPASRQKLSGALYLSSTAIVLVGLAYASVPLYRTFCQQTGYAGTPKVSASAEELRPVAGSRPVRVSFVADVSKCLPWKFVPEQKSILVRPGQTALAFYSATNEGSGEIVGMATYSVIPPKAAEYFNKIQCFCFEEQRLSPGEQVDMPVFFYLDPEFAMDPKMEKVEDIVLGYTFFESKEQQ